MAAKKAAPKTPAKPALKGGATVFPVEPHNDTDDNHMLYLSRRNTDHDGEPALRAVCVVEGCPAEVLIPVVTVLDLAEAAL